jgi:hypothetical protein
MIVRCVDSLFQTDVLVEGGEYEVRAVVTTATSFPASTKASARSGLRSCHSRRSSSAVASPPHDIELEACADAALIKEANGRAIPLNV